ncbi:MAG TPA: aminoglycoside phosphotransferase family protein [Streptosporangiaceae bacterium]|nr:aminoglycoside phosphotransferase family protein [Streptosporangiaceae bacterium]
MRLAAAVGHPGHVLDPDFVLDATARERLVDRFGPGTQQWCDNLPELVAKCRLRWDLELEEALSGATSRVFLGRQHGDRAVVLKLTPDRSVADTEAAALRAWAASPHCVDLLDADAETGALLLEKLEPGTKLGDQAELPPLADIAALLTSLRTADGDGMDQLPPLARRVDFLFTLIGRRLSHPRVSVLVTPGMAARGHRLAQKLATDGDTGLVHGDLHPANVLTAGPDRGLVVIDPRPCFGDRTFDAVDWALGRATTATEVTDRIQQLCGHIPELDGDRLRDWCEATAVIIAVQHLYRRPPGDTTKLVLQLAAAN